MAMAWGTSIRRRPKKSEEEDNRYDLGTMANIRSVSLSPLPSLTLRTTAKPRSGFVVS
jgi:hypothetical protein